MFIQRLQFCDDSFKVPQQTAFSFGACAHPCGLCWQPQSALLSSTGVARSPVRQRLARRNDQRCDGRSYSRRPGDPDQSGDWHFDDRDSSGGTGDYEFPSVKVGDYTVVANAPGFSKAEADHISITVGNRARIDLGLKVGGTETTVEVSGVALQVEADQSQRDQLITNYQSEAFPLVSRNYSDLLGLVTGSRQAPSAATTTSINSLVRAGSYNINGQRSVFNNYQLDGIDNNSYGESNQGFDNQIIAIPPDSVSQFSIVTNNEAAEYGRSSGATINVSSLSGTNAFHGAVYEFIRNTALNAPGFFKPTVIGSTGITTPFKKPTFNRNQFGFNVGGPILRDRLFFFVDYEGFRQVLKPLSVLTLPTQNELNGVFVVPVRNPLTGQVYAAGRPA